MEAPPEVYEKRSRGEEGSSVGSCDPEAERLVALRSLVAKESAISAQNRRTVGILPMCISVAMQFALACHERFLSADMRS